MVCHRNCCSKILLFGILYAAISYNLPAQTTSNRNKPRKKQEDKSQTILSRRDSLSIENKKLRIGSAGVKDSLLRMQTIYENGHFYQVPRSLENKPPLTVSDSLLPYQIKPSSIVNSKEQVFLEYKKDMDKKHKLGEPLYKINPNAFKPTPGNFKPEGSPEEMKTIYDGGHFKQVPKSSSGGLKVSAPLPAFIIGGKKEVSKKDKKILKDVYDIEVK